MDLLEFVSSRHQDLVTASMFPTESSQQGELALTSLAHVIRNNAGVEMQTIGHFKMIFSLLESHFSSHVPHLKTCHPGHPVFSLQ